MTKIEINDVLRRSMESAESPAQRKLIWHLHSYLCEDGGDNRLDRELAEWFAADYERISGRIGFSPMNAERALEYVISENEWTPRWQSDVLPLLEKHMEHSDRLARESFYQTNIGQTVWETLDWCLEERAPCFIEGLEGRGKSATTKAWHAAHRGESRYAQLTGFGTQRDFFTALARAYGIPFATAKAPSEIRFRLRDVIVRSKLVLIIDESHFALPERAKHGRPALIDWIDCELCNHGVPVALITTPQFAPRLAEFENRERETYNANQFKRRFSRKWCQLETKTSDDHLLELAKRVLPNVGKKGFALAAEYAGAFGRDVSGLFDLVRDAERRARKAGHTAATFENLRDAYKLDRIPTENAIAASFSGTSSRVIAPDPQTETSRETAETVEIRRDFPVKRLTDKPALSPN